MKIERVVLRGFLSHRDTDWSPNGARLVSLVGPNGAGKSTLAWDALMYALYDGARGRSDDLVMLGATEASALVEFTYRDARYRVTRGRTTKAGGKSHLELAIADGEAWRPLTRETIRETEAAIAELLRLDADTFATAVMLGQGKANRFADATAGDRKRILSQVLGLDVYATAEARARELARDVEARISADRAQAERLESVVGVGREGNEAELAQGREQLQVVEASIAEKTAQRESIDARIRELEQQLAATKAIADQVTGLEREKAAAGETWRRARDRAAASQVEITRLEALLLEADVVAEAAAEVPAALANVEQLVAGEAEERRLSREIADMERAIRDLEIPHQQAVATWAAEAAAKAKKVAELEAHAKAGTSVCESCGQAIAQDTALEQLKAARGALRELGDQPQAPVAIARARAGKARLETRLAELGWDPTILVAARDTLAALERHAARGETIAAAQTSIERETVSIVEAEAEQARITERGAALAAEIAELAPKVAGKAEDEAAWASARNEAVAAGNEITVLDGSRRLRERAIAAAEARLEGLERQAAQATEIRTRLEADETEARRLRQEVQAFGVTGIPARIIEGVLPELASYANELLADLRPGMTLELRAQRAKKDGKGTVEALDLVVRDAVGERPLALFSGGERMSVSLALAVGLSRLVARRAGARIESLVVDEPDGLDANARRAFGQALRVIAHRGDLARVVVVSHHDDLAEFADEIYQVTKGPQGSVVELVT